MVKDIQKEKAIQAAIQQAKVDAARKEIAATGRARTNPELEAIARRAIQESKESRLQFERQTRIEQGQPVVTTGIRQVTARGRPPQVVKVGMKRALPVSIDVSPRQRFQEERTAGLKKFRESAAVKKPFSRELTKASVKLLELGRPTKESSKSIKQLFVEGISPIARRKQQLKEVKELVKAPISLVGGLGLVVAQPRETLGPFVQTAPKISSPGKKFFVRTAGTAGAIAISTARGLKQEFKLGSREAAAAQILTAVALPKAVSKLRGSPVKTIKVSPSTRLVGAGPKAKLVPIKGFIRKVPIKKFKVKKAVGIKTVRKQAITFGKDKTIIKASQTKAQPIQPTVTRILKKRPATTTEVSVFKGVIKGKDVFGERTLGAKISRGKAVLELREKGFRVSTKTTVLKSKEIKSLVPFKDKPRVFKQEEFVFFKEPASKPSKIIVGTGITQARSPISFSKPVITKTVTPKFAPTPSRAPVGALRLDPQLSPVLPKKPGLVFSVQELSEVRSPFLPGVISVGGLLQKPSAKITQTQPVISVQKQPQVQRVSMAIQPARIVSAKARVIIQKPVPITITAPILKTKQGVRTAITQQRITRQKAVMPKVSALRIPVARLSFPISKTPLKVRTSPLGRGFKVSFLRRGKLELSRFAAFETKGEARRFGAIASLRTKSIKGFTIRQTQFTGTERLFKNLPRFSVLAPSFTRSGSLFVEKPRKRKKKKKGGKR